MKKNKLLAALLSLTVVLATLPAATSTAEAEDNSENIAVQAATGWQPKATRTVASKDFPITISNGETVQINGTVNYTAATGKSPITIATNATAKIIISGSVTLHGANAKGTTGATAAIYVPSNSTLTIYSAHDEELSKTSEKPKDTLTLTGGNAADGGNGGNAEMKSNLDSGNLRYKWSIGAGGNGGGGAAAAIGGNGGNGGSGGAAKACNVELTVNVYGHMFSGAGDDHKGASGNNGANGTAGTSAGKINISGRLTLNATGGSGGAGGNGGSGCGGRAQTSGKDDMAGGCGGGGGGGGGLAAPAIGAGGAGGSGGGSGGELSSDHNGNVQGCGGGGGGGGWPNGGGGGGGGAECSDALDDNDNTSYGGAGGSGGAAGAAGSAGGSGHSTGTKGHGINNGRYDAEPGSGGSGGYGVSSTSTAGGGSGGTEKDHSYNAGNGGSGGKYTSRTAWNTQGNLILSTASKLNLSSSLSYNYGDGQGQGSMSSMTPYIIYDLMDCKVSLSSCTYPGADNQATTKITSITYSSSTDRDGSLVGSSRTLSSTRAKIEGYSGLRHYNKGQAIVTGNNDASRTTVTADQSVIGSKTENFTISKASLSDVDINGDVTNAQVDSPVTLSIGNIYTSAGKTITASNLCKNTSGTKGSPTVSWSVNNNKGTFSSTTGTSTKFTPSSSGSIQITVTISGMNDFNSYTKTITFAVGKADLEAEFSTDSPHPRKDISVILPSDLGNATIQWYIKGNVVCTEKTYTVDGGTSGQSLSVKVTPTDTNSKYATKTFTVPNKIETHNYTDNNGFCKICGEYEPPSTLNDGYLINNGGKMFWFAALINGEDTHAYFTEYQSSHTDNAIAAITADIDLEGSEGREWTPIKDFKSTISSLTFSTPCKITNMRISGEYPQTGFIGNAAGATISDLIVEGTITLPEKDCQDIDGNAVGGVVGFLDGGSVKNVTSKVTIENEGGGVYKHVGGIVGEIQNTKTIVTKSIFEGDIHILNSYDCIGGIVGYSNQGARISYCANLGSVVTDLTNAEYPPYTGGILGYFRNEYVTVKNCYSYGTVDNGGGDHAGAIIGYFRNNTDQTSRFANNYYLRGSAASGIGSGSVSVSGTAVPTIKNKSAFASGEVCYLVNGKTSDSGKAIWRQNIDNTRTPYDSYPLLWTYSDSIVYYRSDDTYSNYAESVSVNISWGDMSFEYIEGDWDPGKHRYEYGVWEPIAENGNKITVTNNSTVAVKAGFQFTPDSNSGLTNFKSTFSGNTSYRLEKKGASNNGNITTTQLTLSSDKPTSTFTNKKLGTITITITAAGGNS